MEEKPANQPQLVLLTHLDLYPGTRKRSPLLKQLSGALKMVNRHVAAITPLKVINTDKVYGVYAAPHLGFEAAIQLSLEATGPTAMLIGLGWGKAGARRSGSTTGRSGPAMRKAREALSVLREGSGRSRRPAGWRTNFIGDDPTLDDALVAWLICRDELTSKMDRRDALITLGMLRGVSQQKMGRQLDISQSAVAGRLKRNGAYAILAARKRLDAIARGENWPGGFATPADPPKAPGAGGRTRPGRTAPGSSIRDTV